MPPTRKGALGPIAVHSTVPTDGAGREPGAPGHSRGTRHSGLLCGSDDRHGVRLTGRRIHLREEGPQQPEGDSHPGFRHKHGDQKKARWDVGKDYRVQQPYTPGEPAATHSEIAVKTLDAKNRAPIRAGVQRVKNQ